MTRLIASETLIWLILMVVTLSTWGLIEGVHTGLAILTVVFLSSLKVLLIGVFYMEFLKANNVFKRFYPIWITLVALMIALFKILGA